VNIYFCGVIFFKVVVLTVDASYHYHRALAYLFQVTLKQLLKQPIRPWKVLIFLGFMRLKTQCNVSYWMAKSRFFFFAKIKNITTY